MQQEKGIIGTSGTSGTGIEGSETTSLCTFRIGERSFGVDTLRVREVLGAWALQPVPLAAAYIGGMLPYRGEVLSTLSLRALLGLERSEGRGCVMVLDDSVCGERFGLLVDAVGGVVSIGDAELEPNPCTLDLRCQALFAGSYDLADGLVVRLSEERLSPVRLAENGIFAAAWPQEQQRRAGLRERED